MPTITPPQPAAAEPLQPVAALLAFILPGLGHFYLGYTRRAILIAAGVLGLFASGLFIGGVDCVDRRENFIWFLGQALVGPVTFSVDYVHQTRFKVYDAHPPHKLRIAQPDEFRDPESGRAVKISTAGGPPSATYVNRAGQTITVTPAYPPIAHSLGRMNELGTLFITIAGFMNLICILDALWHTPKPRTQTPPRGRGEGVGSVPAHAQSPRGRRCVVSIHELSDLLLIATHHSSLATLSPHLPLSPSPHLLLLAAPYRPFIDPIAIHTRWYLLLPPMALGIAVVYKAVRMRDLTRGGGYTRAVAVMTAQIILGMILLAVTSYLVVMVFARFIATHQPG